MARPFLLLRHFLLFLFLVLQRQHAHNKKQTVYRNKIWHIDDCELRLWRNKRQ